MNRKSIAVIAGVTAVVLGCMVVFNVI